MIHGLGEVRIERLLDVSPRCTAAVGLHRAFPAAKDVKCELLAQGEEVCRHLLPAGKRVRNEWIPSVS